MVHAAKLSIELSEDDLFIWKSQESILMQRTLKFALGLYHRSTFLPLALFSQTA